MRRNELEHLIPGYPVQQRLVEPRFCPIATTATARAGLESVVVVPPPLLVWDRLERPNSSKRMPHMMEESRKPNQRPHSLTTSLFAWCAVLDSRHPVFTDFRLSHRVFDPAVAALRRIHPRLRQKEEMVW